jgi:hypothetical protein
MPPRLEHSSKRGSPSSGSLCGPRGTVTPTIATPQSRRDSSRDSKGFYQCPTQSACSLIRPNRRGLCAQKRVSLPPPEMKRLLANVDTFPEMSPESEDRQAQRNGDSRKSAPADPSKSHQLYRRHRRFGRSNVGLWLSFTFSPLGQIECDFIVRKNVAAHRWPTLCHPQP